jgi:hypothetical protein
MQAVWASLFHTQTKQGKPHKHKLWPPGPPLVLLLSLLGATVGFLYTWLTK